ncbi:MAG TPA: acyl-CoA desaturase [Thermoanaerobaculia bacterium]|jgi:linoleoyl-CoA desaturase|nr:acyl-CoA desaturase [Thermoanaerobaculia bacterium]
MEARFRFQSERPFQQALQIRVEERLAALGRTRYGAARLYLKTAVIVLWMVLSYAGLLAAEQWWQALPLAASLGLALAAIGFNVGHDGNHGASSSSKLVNRSLGALFDLLGGSSYVWRFKHNVLHHSYPNVNGLDDDIDLGPLCRMSRHQPHLPHHRLQHLYMWVLYTLIVPKWQFLDDFSAVIRGRIGETPFPRPRGVDLAVFVLGKLAFFGWVFLLPARLHPLSTVLLFYGIVAAVQGLTLSIVFQLAHSNDETYSFAGTGADPESEWAVHQIETTANFARHNRLLTWYVGGLNHQVEHHLFPRISHVHLHLIADEVAKVCREHGVRYREYPSLASAVVSHFRWLRDLGVPPRAGA